MTYIVACRLPGAVLLFADSAVTRTSLSGSPVSDLAMQPSYSSFGELLVREPDLSIDESGKKLVRLQTAGVAMCGDADLCRALAKSLEESLISFDDPMAAMTASVNSLGPFEPSHRAELLVALPVAPHPRLFILDTASSIAVKEFPGFGTVQVGSIRDDYKRLAQYVFRDLPNKSPWANDLLACALGVFQGFGVLDYQIPSGVGGSFWGLSVVHDGIHWQGDILYVMTADLCTIDRWTTTRVREDCLIAQSNDGWSKLLLDHHAMVRAARFNTDEWFEIGRAALLEHRWDYVSFINTRSSVVVVADMRKEESSGLCKVSVIQMPDGGLVLDVALREEASQIFLNPPQPPRSSWPTAGVCFIPFELGSADAGMASRS